jgi:hypothetical protein
VQRPHQRLRVVPRAVGEAVDPALDRLPQRLEGHGHHGGRGPGQPARAALVQHGADARDHQHVDAGHHGGEQRVEQGPVDQEVYLVEPVLEDREAHGHGQRRHGEGEDRSAEHAGREQGGAGDGDDEAQGEPAHLLAHERGAVPPAVRHRHEPGDQAERAEREGHDDDPVGHEVEVRRQADRVVGTGDPVVVDRRLQEDPGDEEAEGPDRDAQPDPAGPGGAVGEDQGQDDGQDQPAQAAHGERDQQEDACAGVARVGRQVRHEQLHRQQAQAVGGAAGQQGPAHRLTGPAGQHQGADRAAGGHHERVDEACLLLPEVRTHGDDGRGDRRGRRAQRGGPEEELHRPRGRHGGILAHGTR